MAFQCGGVLRQNYRNSVTVPILLEGTALLQYFGTQQSFRCNDDHTTVYSPLGKQGKEKVPSSRDCALHRYTSDESSDKAPSTGVELQPLICKKNQHSLIIMVPTARQITGLYQHISLSSHPSIYLGFSSQKPMGECL